MTVVEVVCWDADPVWTDESNVDLFDFINIWKPNNISAQDYWRVGSLFGTEFKRKGLGSL